MNVTIREFVSRWSSLASLAFGPIPRGVVSTHAVETRPSGPSFSNLHAAWKRTRGRGTSFPVARRKRTRLSFVDSADRKRDKALSRFELSEIPREFEPVYGLSRSRDETGEFPDVDPLKLGYGRSSSQPRCRISRRGETAGKKERKRGKKKRRKSKMKETKKEVVRSSSFAKVRKIAGNSPRPRRWTQLVDRSCTMVHTHLFRAGAARVRVARVYVWRMKKPADEKVSLRSRKSNGWFACRSTVLEGLSHRSPDILSSETSFAFVRRSCPGSWERLLILDAGVCELAVREQEIVWDYRNAVFWNSFNTQNLASCKQRKSISYSTSKPQSVNIDRFATSEFYPRRCVSPRSRRSAAAAILC